MFRKNISILLLMVAALVLFWGARCLSDDTEIYTNSGQGVEPNVLIIFDNSGSMNDEIPSEVYDRATTYAGAYDAAKVYYRWRGSWDHILRDSTAEIACDECLPSYLFRDETLHPDLLYLGKRESGWHPAEADALELRALNATFASRDGVLLRSYPRRCFAIRI
ncbi:MAG: hypothetical protein JSW15_04755 [Deltaproteobacteria bacterium]|nr:MAG: hypothetical protein JSW15_04755 [Deltaproteobacteria bacterium]